MTLKISMLNALGPQISWILFYRTATCTLSNYMAVSIFFKDAFLWVYLLTFTVILCLLVLFNFFFSLYHFVALRFWCIRKRSKSFLSVSVVREVALVYFHIWVQLGPWNDSVICPAYVLMTVVEYPVGYLVWTLFQHTLIFMISIA